MYCKDKGRKWPRGAAPLMNRRTFETVVATKHQKHKKELSKQYYPET
jgi:hypothetical protein